MGRRKGKRNVHKEGSENANGPVEFKLRLNQSFSRASRRLGLYTGISTY
jgi:hypothetical protein